MANSPLAVLKDGLAKIRGQYEEKRKALNAKLANKEKISDGDEQWLDQEGNLVGGEQFISELENAMDYKHGLGQLDERKKGILKRLTELARGAPKVVGNKRKRPNAKEPYSLTTTKKNCARHFDPIYPNLQLTQPLVSGWVRDSLLNPESEKIMVTADESTDEEICKAVLSAQTAKEDTVTNGGDDDVDNNG
ncbi:hypothetical protein BT96DRAFT_950451 [Gymnopus androsaceus JB14]|uniref:Uncharacterized protein n=1 Tax=Gymnopus androsaceus JB14 TaxID=1447944 RepID=A0A6A4GGH8_9AGAR|nr:hypothetical protein BT96DRAFT_950451 [Gymnopus androsaceus JB14]